jgi:hypothetical protein
MGWFFSGLKYTAVCTINALRSVTGQTQNKDNMHKKAAHSKGAAFSFLSYFSTLDINTTHSTWLERTE